LKYLRFWLIAGGVLAGDQASKAWIAARVPFESGAIPVIPRFFYLIHVANTGAAWSMFTGKSAALAVLAALTLAVIFVWRRALGLHEPATQLCFGLLCGGIAGNLADRVARGYVIDFIDLHFGRYIYPTFNVADSAICVGVALYVARSLFRKSPAAS
jgi:signal peptidase II